MQPEGNLFRDRFLSLQQRGLVEPRSLVLYVSYSEVRIALFNDFSQRKEATGKDKGVRKARVETFRVVPMSLLGFI
jgi:hypothetical protein